MYGVELYVTVVIRPIVELLVISAVEEESNVCPVHASSTRLYKKKVTVPDDNEQPDENTTVAVSKKGSPTVTVVFDGTAVTVTG